MNIKPKTLAIQGFGSFTRDEIFRFPENPGFFFLTGENRVEPDLDPNGSGKSTIWKAWCWCQYGQTDRGVKAGGVANWTGSCLTSVIYEFEKDGELYSLMRAWNPNALSLTKKGHDPQVVTQEYLNDFLGLDFQGFLYVVLMSQFGNFFFDLGTTEKLTVFSNALQLDFWVKKSDETKKGLKKKEEEKDKIERNLISLQTEWNTLGTQLESTKAKAKDWGDLRGKRLIEAEAESSKFDEQKQLAETALLEIQASVQPAIDAFTLAESSFIDASRVHRARESRYFQEEFGEQKRVKDAIDFIDRQLAAAEKEKVCPKCGQPVDKQELITRLQAEKVATSNLVEIAATAVALAKKEISELNAAVTRSNAALNLAREGRERATAAVRQAKMAVANLAERASTAGIEVGRILKEVNPFDDTIVRLEFSMMGCGGSLEEGRVLLRAIEHRILVLSFWVGAFKDLRLWLIEEAISELEIEVNNVLLSLGLNGWSVGFDIERENTQGGVTKGFEVNIKSPGSSDRVPWKAWSGGETQRLRIAGAVGLMNLISGRTGVNYNVEIWDEPTAHLNPLGIDQLLTFFETRSRSENKQVWLVDHRSYDYGGFDGTMHVIKDEKGSHIEKVRMR